MFVPVRRKRQRQSIGYDEVIHSPVDKVTAALETDPTTDLIKHFERENELARQHEITLFSMIFGQQPNLSQITPRPVKRAQATNVYPPTINNQSHQPVTNTTQQQHSSQTVACSNQFKANVGQQRCNLSSTATNQLQLTQGNVMRQHPNPTSVPVNQPQQSHADVRQQHSYPASMPSGQFRQSLANTVQRRQHADPSSMPTNQLQRSSANKMQPQSTNQTTTANIQLYPASSNPMIQPQYSLWQYTADCVTPVQQTGARTVSRAVQQEAAQETEDEHIYESLF